MTKNKALLNVASATIFKILIVLITIVSRSILMKQIGEEATGLFSLYTSIIGFLAIVELGVGTAITFSLYKPIVEQKKDIVSALYFLYRKIYFIIGLIILGLGLILIPFIPFFAKNQTGTFNIYFTFFIFLGAQIVTYFYAHKSSFINAHLDNYVTTIIHSLGLIIAAALQILVLLIFKDFTLFLLSILVGNVFQFVLTNIVFSRKYKNLINDNKVLDSDVKNDVIVKVKALFFHRIGGLIINTVDSLIIGAFIGVEILGFYSNYLSIVVGMISVLTLVFSSLTSIIGHSFAKNSKAVVLGQFKLMYLLNFIIGFVAFLGFFMIINPLIESLFTSASILSKDIVFIITISYFIQFMRHSVLTFKDASGLFYEDRFKPLIEGIVKLILSFIFVTFWGIQGLLISTIITNLMITHTVEPYVLFKYGFSHSPKRHYFVNYLLIIIFSVLIYLLNLVEFPIIHSNLISILIYGSASVLFSIILLIIAISISKSFRNSFLILWRFVFSKRAKQ